MFSQHLERREREGEKTYLDHRVGGVRLSVEYGVKQDENLCLVLHRL